jgi:hypothetical protein
MMRSLVTKSRVLPVESQCSHVAVVVNGAKVRVRDTTAQGRSAFIGGEAKVLGE